MRYVYECINDKCVVTTVIVNKPMAKSSKLEVCNGCKEPLKRVYNAPSIKTNDGYKK